MEDDGDIVLAGSRKLDYILFYKFGISWLYYNDKKRVCQDP